MRRLTSERLIFRYFFFCSSTTTMLSSLSLSRKKKDECFALENPSSQSQLNKLSEFLHEHFVYSKCEKNFRLFFLWFLVTFALFLFERWFGLYLHSYSPPIKVFVLVSHSLVASSWACTHIEAIKRTHWHTATYTDAHMAAECDMADRETVNVNVSMSSLCVGIVALDHKVPVRAYQAHQSRSTTQRMLAFLFTLCVLVHNNTHDKCAECQERHCTTTFVCLTNSGFTEAAAAAAAALNHLNAITFNVRRTKEDTKKQQYECVCMSLRHISHSRRSVNIGVCVRVCTSVTNGFERVRERQRNNKSDHILQIQRQTVGGFCGLLRNVWRWIRIGVCIRDNAPFRSYMHIHTSTHLHTPNRPNGERERESERERTRDFERSCEINFESY